MDTNILKTFLEVYRTCHFGKAADNLCVTQSTVSARILQLENELGVKLFKRDRNNIQLTPAGRKFLKHAESILNVWNRARFDLSIQEEGKLPVVIGAVPSLWDIYLVNWLATIRKQFPNLTIIGEAIAVEFLTRQLLDQSVDIGFAYDFPQMPELVIQEFISFELVLVSSKKNMSTENVFKSDYIFINWGASFTEEHARFFPDIPAPDLKLNVGHIALEYIRKNGGSAYLPEPMIKNELTQKTLHLVKGAPEINRKSLVIYRENTSKREFVEKLVSLNNLKP